jgi:hypothetical protein
MRHQEGKDAEDVDQHELTMKWRQVGHGALSLSGDEVGRGGW